MRRVFGAEAHYSEAESALKAHHLMVRMSLLCATSLLVFSTLPPETTPSQLAGDMISLHDDEASVVATLEVPTSVLRDFHQGRYRHFPFPRQVEPERHRRKG